MTDIYHLVLVHMCISEWIIMNFMLKTNYEQIHTHNNHKYQLTEIIFHYVVLFMLNYFY